MEKLEEGIEKMEEEYNGIWERIGEIEDEILRRKTTSLSIGVRELCFIERECEELVQILAKRSITNLSRSEIQDELKMAQRKLFEEMILPSVVEVEDHSREMQKNLESRIRIRMKNFGSEKCFVVKTPEDQVVKGFPEVELKWMFGDKEVVVHKAVGLHLHHGWKKWREEAKADLNRRLLEDDDFGKQYVAQRQCSCKDLVQLREKQVGNGSNEVPIVRVAADVSSSMVSASKPFTNKSISIRLDETNYLLWRQQVLFTIESLDLSSHIDGTSVVPPQYVLVNSEKVCNPQYASFKQQDSALCSWKRDQGMREYIAHIQSVCDSLAAFGNPLSETMHISTILSGLPSDYEPVVAVITSNQQPYKLDGVCGVPSNGPNVFVEQAYHPFVGQVSSSASANSSQRVFSESSSYPQRVFQDSSFSQRGFQGPSFFRGFGFQTGRSFSRGCGGRVFGGRVRPQCQLYGRIGHIVNRCYYCFDRSYDIYYVNLVEEVLDYQKPEGESLNQDLSGSVALVSDDFSPVVCEDATWFPDSGAIAHLTPDLGKFHSSLPYTGSGKITVANGMAVPISHIGNSSLSTNSRSLFLSNLLHVPCVNKNLPPVSRFTKDNNVSMEFFPNSCIVKDLETQQVMLRGSESNGLYKFLCKHGSRVHQVAESCDNSVHQVSISLAHTGSSDICLHQESSAGLSQISNIQDYVLANDQERSAENSVSDNCHLSVGLCRQEHPLTTSKSSLFPVSQESQVSINSSSSVDFQGLPISTNTSTSSQKQLRSLKHKVCFSAVTTMEVLEPKTVKQAFESKEWYDAVNKEYDALIQKGTWDLKGYFNYRLRRIKRKKKAGYDPIRTAFDGMKRVKNPPIPLKDFASIESMREEINEVVAFLQNLVHSKKWVPVHLGFLQPINWVMFFFGSHILNLLLGPSAAVVISH
ncbi:hypothetical protein GQ457_06G018340 [Hibiscus cannabinus]